MPVIIQKKCLCDVENIYNKRWHACKWCHYASHFSIDIWQLISGRMRLPAEFFSFFFFLLSFLLYSSVIWCIVCSSCFHLLNRTGSDFKKNMLLVVLLVYTTCNYMLCIPCINNEKCFFYVLYSECERFFFLGDKMISFYLKIYTN